MSQTGEAAEQIVNMATNVTVKGGSVKYFSQNGLQGLA